MARLGSSIIKSSLGCLQLVRVVSVRLPRKAPGTVDGSIQDGTTDRIDYRKPSIDVSPLRRLLYDVREYGEDENENKLSRSRTLAIIARLPLPISHGACAIETPALRKLEMGIESGLLGKTCQGHLHRKAGGAGASKYGKPVTVQNMYILRTPYLATPYQLSYTFPTS